MAYTLTIDGVSKSIQPGWRIDEMINNRNTFEFEVNSVDGTYRPSPRVPVIFDNGVSRIFGGNIENLEESGLGGYGVVPITTRVGAIDFNALPDRRFIAITLAAGNLKSMLTTLTTYLTNYGVTLDAGQVNGPSIAEDLVFQYSSLTSILNNLSVITGYLWNITYYGVLSMNTPGYTTASFSITDGDGNINGDLVVRPSLADYANRIIVRFTSEAQTAYAFFRIRTGDNVANGETTTVGGKTYTFQTTLTDVDGNIQIGATGEDTLTNLNHAIVLSGTPGTHYAAAMTVNSSVNSSIQSTELVRVTALSTGESGNSIACTDTCADGDWITEGGGVTATLLFGADESLSNSVIANDVSEQNIGGTGANLIERVYEHPEILDTATAQHMADGYLVRSIVTPREIKFTTLRSGLTVGMQVSITSTMRDISGYCLIQSVSTFPVGNLLFYEITAVEGLVITPSYIDTYKQWNAAGSGSSLSGFTSFSSSSSGFSSPISFGGSGSSAVTMDSVTPAYLPIAEYRDFFAPATFTGEVKIYAWSFESGVNLLVRIKNITDNTVAATSGTISNSSRPSSPSTLSVVFTSGKQYRVEILGDLPDGNCFCVADIYP